MRYGSVAAMVAWLDREEVAAAIGMGRRLNCVGDFGTERRCFGELSKKQDGDMDNLKVGDSRRRRMPGARMSGF